MASIIRHGAQSTTEQAPQVRAVAFDFHDMSNRAEAYVLQVRNEAAKIVQQAHADAERVRRNAEKAGRDAAEKAIDQVLSEMVGRQIETLRPALAGIVSQLEATRGEWLEHWRTAALGLSIKIAERLVRGELSKRPDIAEQWLREALTLTAGGGEITVRLNPADHAHLAPKAEEIAADMGRLAQTRIVQDASISAGGCLVETRYGSVDMQLESQLARIAEELD